MRLYHVTTARKARLYRQGGSIRRPVRGFDSLLAAMAWAVKTGRKVVYSFEAPCDATYLLPDHHNDFGRAFWVDADIPVDGIRCEFSAGGAIHAKELEATP